MAACISGLLLSAERITIDPFYTLQNVSFSWPLIIWYLYVTLFQNLVYAHMILVTESCSIYTKQTDCHWHGGMLSCNNLINVSSNRFKLLISENSSVVLCERAASLAIIISRTIFMTIHK